MEEKREKKLVDELAGLYPGIERQVLSGYELADTHITYMEDDRMTEPVVVDVADVIKKTFMATGASEKLWKEHQKTLLAGYYPELWHTIEGFGLPAHKQKYSSPQIPKQLKELQKNSVFMEDAWTALEENYLQYKEEWKFIEDVIHARHYGKWYFIKGKPRWFDPFAYVYFGYWELDVGLPEFRDSSRRKFLYRRYAYTCTTAKFKYRMFNRDRWFHTNDKDKAKEWRRQFLVEEGNFVLDYGKRTCYGTIEPKARRVGGTYEAACCMWVIATDGPKRQCWMQSMDGGTAKETWNIKYDQPMKALPFFIQPSFYFTKANFQFIGSTPKSKGAGSVNTSNTGLESSINYLPTADDFAMDGKKAHGLHNNEIGKMTEGNFLIRHRVTKPCMKPGDEIEGFNISESTVEEMNKRGGDKFLEVMKNSHPHKVMNEITGETESGLFVLFLPAYEGFGGYIDEWGDSIIEDPVIPVKNSKGNLVSIGARTYLNNELEIFNLKNDTEGFADFTRKYPQKLSDCFMQSSRDSGFNQIILSKRLNQLVTDEGMVKAQRGDFVWKTQWRTVEWVPNEYSGKYYCSWFWPDERKSCQMIFKDGMWWPRYTGFGVASLDSFKFENSKNTRLSDAGFAVFMDRNVQLDNTDDITNWTTNRFVCTYRHRASTHEECFEDVLMACMYFGVPLYPENNVRDIIDLFHEYQFGGYLLYDVDPRTGETKDVPGFWSGGSSDRTRKTLFAALRNHIELHGMREEHADLLGEISEINGLEEMTKFDLFTAAGGCLLGIRSMMRQMLTTWTTDKVEESDWSYDNIFQ